MNREKYNGDPRYAKVLEKMDLLGIMDITTTRQNKNGTIVWKLPIKKEYSKLCIEVASFKSGYVRNQGVSCHSNYQLNKRCQSEPEYFKLANGDYRKFETRGCVLIPIEIDRLEYLISYCLKNYYIKHANFVANGDYIHKGLHNWEIERAKKACDNMEQRADDFENDCGHYDRINDLESEVRNLESKYQASQSELEKAYKNEFYPYSMEIRVNGQRYKVV